MARVKPLPDLWLLSDRRNDAGLEAALHRLPPRSGFVFRHYHCDAGERRARFAALAEIARQRDHVVVLAAAPELALAWGADGHYGTPGQGKSAELHLATAHDADEMAAANAAGAAGVFLSPVFPTVSHPDAKTLGSAGFHALARQSAIPVIALGGMTAARAQDLGWPRWGAIDGLGSPLDA